MGLDTAAPSPQQPLEVLAWLNRSHVEDEALRQPVGLAHTFLSSQRLRAKVRRSGLNHHRDLLGRHAIGLDEVPTGRV